MSGGESFTMAEEFADADFNGARLEKRLVRTMETLSSNRVTQYGQAVRTAPKPRTKVRSDLPYAGK
jgi:5S rRNA maturation endonuclease (ribonuclease M5)